MDECAVSCRLMQGYTGLNELKSRYCAFYYMHLECQNFSAFPAALLDARIIANHLLGIGSSPLASNQGQGYARQCVYPKAIGAVAILRPAATSCRIQHSSCLIIINTYRFPHYLNA